jgi:hypothetical protein
MKMWAFDPNRAEELTQWKLIGHYTETAAWVCVGEWIPVWVDRDVGVFEEFMSFTQIWVTSEEGIFFSYTSSELRAAIEKSAYWVLVLLWRSPGGLKNT